MNFLKLLVVVILLSGCNAKPYDHSTPWEDPDGNLFWCVDGSSMTSKGLADLICKWKPELDGCEE